MDRNKPQQSVIPSGEKSSILDTIFRYYLYLCLVWVFFALGFDLYMIIKHFNEF